MKIGFLIYPNAQPIDFIGPWDVFSLWNKVAKDKLSLSLVSEQAGMVDCDGGINICSHYGLNDAPQFDVLLVPGGMGRLDIDKTSPLIQFIRNQAANARQVLSVCTGMFLLEKAELLAGKSVTSYWLALPELKTFDNLVPVQKRIVKSGKIWTAGGVTSGIDLALEFIAEIISYDAAGVTQLLLEYFPEQKIFASPNNVDLIGSYNNHKPTIDDLPEYIRCQLNNDAKGHSS